MKNGYLEVLEMARPRLEHAGTQHVVATQVDPETGTEKAVAANVQAVRDALYAEIVIVDDADMVAAVKSALARVIY